MEIATELSEQITSRLAEFINNPSNAADLRDYSQQVDALMLFLDMGGFYAIRPNGEIISCEWDSETLTPRVEDDMRIRNIALFQGSKKYPELKALIPSRTDDDRECSYCLGKGILPFVAEYNLTNVVCYCGGLGWLPKEQGI